MVEDPFRMEPMKLPVIGEELTDAIADLSASVATLGRALHPKTARGLADLVRVMNCYYSNLIEGHNTRPRDIMTALKLEAKEGGQDGKVLVGMEDRDGAYRNLVLEAVAHIRVQENIDRMAAAGVLPEPASADFVKGVHQDFYSGLPRDMLHITGAGRDFYMVPGEFRSQEMHDVQVGAHIPPASDSVEAFMQRFAEVYRLEGGRMGGGILSMAAAHHRFAFIHPFADGNGRVVRLLSHSMAHKIGIGAHGLWSVSRGLARDHDVGLEGRGEYKRLLARADMPRQGDLDGRGSLSQRALAEWCLWFVKVCLDQVTFMASLFDLNTLADRLRRYVRLHDDKLPAVAGDLLVEMLMRGEIERGEIPRILQMPERSARRVTAMLAVMDLIEAESSRGAFHLTFPAVALEDLFPRLFPAAAA